MKFKFKIASAILMLLAVGGCASQYKHPTFYGRENIQYVAPSNCEELEKSYAIALAWEKEIENRLLPKIFSLVRPLESIAFSYVNPGIFAIDPKQQNEKFLKETKELFLKKECSTIGYVALNESQYSTNSRSSEKAVNSCELDGKTGFYVCIKNNGGSAFKKN